MRRPRTSLMAPTVAIARAQSKRYLSKVVTGGLLLCVILGHSRGGLLGNMSCSLCGSGPIWAGESKTVGLSRNIGAEDCRNLCEGTIQSGCQTVHAGGGGKRH